MRKVFLILLTVLCISCSKDDESSNSAISINPPQWVQGNWAYSGYEDNGAIFRITSNDVVFIANTAEMSYKGQMEDIAKAGGDVSVDEVISTEMYEVTFNMSQGFSQTYTFEKVNETTIMWDTDWELTKL